MLLWWREKEERNCWEMLEKIMRNLLEFVMYFCWPLECIRGWVGHGGCMGVVFGSPSFEQNRFGTYWQTIVTFLSTVITSFLTSLQPRKKQAMIFPLSKLDMGWIQVCFWNCTVQKLMIIFWNVTVVVNSRLFWGCALVTDLLLYLLLEVQCEWGKYLIRLHGQHSQFL